MEKKGRLAKGTVYHSNKKNINDKNKTLDLMIGNPDAQPPSSSAKKSFHR